jgi:hypothetical protein
MRFQDLPVSELKNIIEKYKDRTTIKGYKSMKKSELLIELGNRFSIVNGNLYLKKDAENERNKMKVKNYKNIEAKLIKLDQDLQMVIFDMKKKNSNY